jgi:hypothetical protein
VWKRELLYSFLVGFCYVMVILYGKYVVINCEGIELCGKGNCCTVFWLVFIMLW